MSGVNELFFRFHEKLANAFRGYGAFVARHTLGVFACGFIFFFCISFGIYAASKETELDKLWVETGSRITPEKDFYESKFGGLTRQQPVALVAVGSDQVITKANLDAWRAILIPMLTEDESNPYNAALASVSSPLQTNVKFFDSGKTAKLTQKVFCERPPIPPLYFSDALFQGAFGRSYNVSGYCTNAACGYAALVRCLNRQASFFFGSDLVLGFGWGLDRFPCTRTVALDCFTEGDFDYPLAMKQLDRVAWRVLLASTQPTGLLATAYSTCINEAVATYSIPPAVLPSTGLTAVQAGQLPTILRLSVQAFGSFGYWWRQSYRSLTDDAALTTYMNTAIENGLNPGITSTDCFTQSLTQGLPNKGRECCVNWSGTKVGEQLYGGGITYGTGKLSATRLVANNWHQDHPTLKIQLAAAFRAAGMSTDLPNTIDRKALVEQYEAVWQNYLQPFWRRDSGTGFAAGENNSNLRLYFAMWRATDDTIREGSEAEAPLLIGAHILLIGYICLCLSKLSWPCSGVNAVYSHVGLAIWAVITEIGSVVASFGVMGIINVKLSPIALSLIPFLSLGIGIDDMLVLGHTLMIHNKSNDVLNRMKEVLGVCCPAILQTTMANITAFFIASITPIRVVQSFSIHMGFAILLNFIALLVIFVPVMAWDIQRTMAKRTDFYVAPCIVIDGNIPNENDPSISEGGNIVTNITKTYVSPVLQMWWVKVLVLCAIYAYTAAMAWNGAVNTQKGLKLSDIALRGSFVREYTDVQEKYFGSYASFLVTKDIDYKNQGFQSRLLYTLHQLDKSKWRSLAMRVVDLSWFATSSSRFLGYGTSAGFNTGLATPLDPLAFDVVFAGWITTLGITSAPDIYCESLRTGLQVDCTSYQPGNTTIKASRHTMYNHNLFTNEDTIAAMADNRYAADSGLAPGEGYMFGFIYQFYQQYVNIDSNLYKVVGWSLLGVFGTTLLFTFSPIAAGIMCLVILQIVVQLWGMCRIIDVKLNAFSVVNLCFSVGIAVEFTSYVTHAFLVAKGNRNQRMAYAVEEMMAPMFNGAVSTFLAVVVLVGAKFPFFRIYYFAMFSLMVALALINGMFCLPILLSLVGPPSMHGENDDNSKDIGMQRLDTHDTQSTANLAV